MRIIATLFILLTSTVAQAKVLPHPAGCPRVLFCGCGVSVKVFGRPIKELFVAVAWGKFPSWWMAPGMVAWRQHHVVYIVEPRGSNAALVYDPNSGGRLTRLHVRSLEGFRIVNPHGARVAAQVN